MTIPFLDIVGGFTDISAQLLELYKIRRDGSFFQQQQFLADIRAIEATLTEERTLKRDELLAQLSEKKSTADELRAAEREIRTTQLAIASKIYTERLDRHIANSPFEYDPEEIFRRVGAATEGGKRPVLLIAPFLDDGDGRAESESAPPTFRVGIRRAWMGSPWFDDLTLLDGLISRPLRNTDVDILVIREVLRDLPVVLVYGEIQNQRRAWCSVVAWNLVPGEPVGTFSVNLPALPLPIDDRAFEGDSQRLEFEDALGRAVALAAGVISQWFYIANYCRPPRYEHLSQGLDAVICASLASAFEISIQKEPSIELSARTHQAQLYEIGGLVSGAHAAVSKAIQILETSPAPDQSADLSLLETLIHLVRRLGDESLKHDAESLLEEASRKFVLKYLDPEVS